MSLSIQQAAEAVGVTPQAIWQAIDSKRLKAEKQGRKWVIDEVDLFLIYSKVEKKEQSSSSDLTSEINRLQAELKAIAELKGQIEGERDNLKETNRRLLEDNGRLVEVIHHKEQIALACQMEKMKSIEGEIVGIDEGERGTAAPKHKIGRIEGLKAFFFGSNLQEGRKSA